MDLVLASASPRRAELLTQMGLTFRIVESKVLEGEANEPFSKWVQDLAKAKALAVAAHTGEIVVGADTIVVKDKTVLGKPMNKPEAKAILSFLAGSSHIVLTGVCVIDNRQGQIYQAVETTRVYFRKFSNWEIETYLASGEPYDKAGAYGIQGLGALLVEKIEGCYFNVVGLPLVKLMGLLREAGVPVLGVDAHGKG